MRSIWSDLHSYPNVDPVFDSNVNTYAYFNSDTYLYSDSDLHANIDTYAFPHP